MRTIMTIILLLNNLILAQANWILQIPFPQGNNLNDVVLLDENKIYAVGDASTFIKSTDGGLNWECKSNIANSVHQIRSIYFLNQQKGFAVAHDNSGDLYNGWLFKTDDGGNLWTLQTFSFNLCKVFFIDDNNGWIVGNQFGIPSQGRILKTTDGGLNWIQTSFSIEKELTDIKFTDPMNGWVVGDGIILKTTDGGENWTVINENYFYLRSLDIVNQQQIYVVGNGIIMKTADGGLTWKQQTFNEYLFITSVKFVDELLGFAVSQSFSPNEVKPLILKTTDGGASWISTENKNNLFSISLLNLSNIVAVGEGGAIIKSSDGINWISLNKGDNSIIFQDILFVNENVGWALGFTEHYEFDIVYKTTDNGNTWLEQSRNAIPNYNPLNILYFINEANGWAVGSSRIMKTTDGGESWSVFSTDGYLHNIIFLDSLNGFAVGTKLLKSADGGNNWTQLDLPPNVDRIYDIDFADPTTTFIAGSGIGSSGYIYKSTDFGDSWILNYTSSNNLTKIFMVDSMNGWAAGTSSSILRTTDGGMNWKKSSFSGFQFTASIFFINKNVGWVLREGGEILMTSDGGTSWNSSAMKYPLANDLFFINEHVGWMCGDNGTIFKTTNGGVTFVEDDTKSILPQGHFLSQNYPNPFNPSTKIKYSIPRQSFVNIKVYDLLGRAVATLVNEEKPTGNYEVEFNANSLSNGIYFYRLKANGFVETKKMILLK